MKLIDNIINKFGSDKIPHFLVGGENAEFNSIISLAERDNYHIIDDIVEFAKEKWFDTVFDKKDFIATLLGSLFTVIIYVISVIL